MLTINTISEFQSLHVSHQEEVLRGIRAKDRLDTFLLSLNKAPPPEEPHWVKCHKCHPDYPGWHWKEQHVRDNSDIHPSQIDKCLKYLVLCCSGVAEHHEEVVNPQLRMIFDIGHAWHHVMQTYGRKGAFCEPQYYHPEEPIDPDAVTFDGHPALPIANEFWIRGSADALIDQYQLSTPSLGDVSIRLIHEYKTIKSTQYEKLTRPKPEHKKQATIYSAVFNVPVVVYLYTNKDNCQLADFPVPFDNGIWNDIVQKVRLIQHHTDSGQMVPWEHTSALLAPNECTQCGLRKVCKPPSMLRRIG
jgi:hypothetical protein